MARRATAIDQIRQQAQGAVLVLDSGDTFFGRASPDQSKGALPIAAMNAMGYDAMALGANDLGAPAEVLGEHFQEADFALLSANLGPGGVLPFQPYTLLEVEGHRVALIGATSTRAENQSKLVGKTLEVEHGYDIVQQTVAQLRDQADVIIVLSNLSHGNNQRIATEVPGVDVILGSKDSGSPNHAQQFDGPQGLVVLHHPGSRGQYLALLTLHFDAAGRVASFNGKGLLLTNQYADAPEIVALLQGYGIKP